MTVMLHFFARAGLIVALVLVAGHARAVEIEKVTGPRSGVEAWLVSDATLPIVAVSGVIRRSPIGEPEGKEGLHRMAAGLLDEGAGDLDSVGFQTALEDKAISLGFGGGREATSFGLRTLSAEAPEAFRLLGLALTAPRFDSEPVERVRGQLLSSLVREQENPGAVAGRMFDEALLVPGHPYAGSARGTPENIAGITRADLEAWARGHGRDRIEIVVVGDVDAAALARLLDQAFADLPALGPVETLGAPAFAAGREHARHMDVPQTVVFFGGPGLDRQDPDFIPGALMNHVLGGGGGLTSRLADEVREKRGLAYSVSTGLSTWLPAGGSLTGSVATENTAVRQSIDLIRAEMRRMAEGGVTADELADAKAYLIGSYALNIDSNEGLADTLLTIRRFRLGEDYIERRKQLIESVTAADIARVAERLLKPERFTWVIVGGGVPAPRRPR